MKVDTSFSTLRVGHRLDNEEALRSFFEEMQQDVAGRHESGARKLIAAHWATDLAALMLDRNMATATDVGEKVATALKSEFDPEIMRGWFEANAGAVAPAITAHAEDDLQAADADEEQDDPVGHVFGFLLAAGVARYAQQMVTTSANFAAKDVAEKSGAKFKVWQVNSSKPRSAHAYMSGESVALSENFSNGMAWPGDRAGGADENANCQCSLTIVS